MGIANHWDSFPYREISSSGLADPSFAREERGPYERGALDF